MNIPLRHISLVQSAEGYEHERNQKIRFQSAKGESLHALACIPLRLVSYPVLSKIRIGCFFTSLNRETASRPYGAETYSGRLRTFQPEVNGAELQPISTPVMEYSTPFRIRNGKRLFLGCRACPKTLERGSRGFATPWKSETALWKHPGGRVRHSGNNGFLFPFHFRSDNSHMKRLGLCSIFSLGGSLCFLLFLPLLLYPFPSFLKSLTLINPLNL